MASKKAEVSASALANLYTELNKFGQSEEYDKAIKVANRILGLDKNAVKAFHYRIICQINLGKFEEALKQLNNNVKLSSDLHFEKAYVEYRLNQNEAALSTIEQVKEPSIRLRELKAQVLYKLERFPEAYKAYREVIKNTDDDFNEEREANLAAVLAQLQTSDPSAVGEVPEPEPDTSTYEVLYNSACRQLAAGRPQRAEQQLTRAAHLCRKQLLDDQADQQEIQQETAIIEVQRAYCLQLLGRGAEASEIYHEVLKHRPTDPAVTAVASNNVVALNRDQNVFDSRKRMRAVSAEGVNEKLPAAQRRQIAINQCLFSLLTHQGDQLQRQLAQLTAGFPEEAVTAALIRAAHVGRRNTEEAARQLKELKPGTEQERVRVRLAIVQLYVNKGQLLEACDQLGDLGDLSYRPGVVSARVALCVRAGDQSAAAKILDQAVKWHRNKHSSMTDVSKLWRQSADFSLRCGNPRAAAESLEELRKLSPSDVRTIAQLVTAYSQFDPERARRVSVDLPPAETGPAVDVDALELTAWSSSGKPRRKDAPYTPGSPGSPETPGDALIQKRLKKKKKRKPRLPKNYNPEVQPDPERWLPRRERSSYKPKKRRRNEAMRGTQGGPSAQSDLYDITKTAVQQKAAPIPDQTAGPRQMSRNAQKKKKQGKKNKW